MTKEEELRDYSYGSMIEFSDIDDNKSDYSIGLQDLPEDSPRSLEEDDDLPPFASSGYTGSRLARLGPTATDDPAKKGISTSTHRDSLQTDYDLDSPRNPSNRPQTSTRMARANQSQAAPKEPARYTTSSTRIMASTQRDAPTSSRMATSSSRRLTSG
jgi:hypothetical protein